MEVSFASVTKGRDMERPIVDAQLLEELLVHWRALVDEAYAQGEESNQSALLRGHAYGVGDGLEMAIEHLTSLLEQHR